MTQDLLTDLGEEQLVKRGIDSISVSVGLYNDSTDALSDTSDYDGSTGDITTEPSNTNYAEQSVTLSGSDLSGNWGAVNGSAFSFDFSDQTTSETVDTAFVLHTFTAEDTGDGSATTHLIANPALSQSRDIGSVDSIDFAAGDLSISVD